MGAPLAPLATAGGAAAAAAAVEEPFRDLVGKTWERLLGCALAVLARYCSGGAACRVEGTLERVHGCSQRRNFPPSSFPLRLPRLCQPGHALNILSFPARSLTLHPAFSFPCRTASRCGLPSLCRPGSRCA